MNAAKRLISFSFPYRRWLLLAFGSGVGGAMARCMVRRRRDAYREAVAAEERERFGELLGED